MTQRLAHILCTGPLDRQTFLDLGALLGPEWDGFHIRFVPGDGPGAGWNLFNPQWRRGFSAGELRAHFYAIQGRAADRLALEQARRDSDAADARADAQEARAAYYREQLSLESRAGAMLSRIFTTTE